MKNNGLAFMVMLSALIVLNSCEKSEDQLISIGETTNLVVNIEGNTSSTITYLGTEVPLTSIDETGTIQEKKAKVSSEDVFILESSVSSPLTADGKVLSASFVELLKEKNKVMTYITYNLSGEEHGGALLTVDLFEGNSPKIRSEVIFDDIDINVCEVSSDGNTLWLGGSSLKTGAVIIPVSLKTNGDIDNKNSFEVISINDVASVNGIIQASDWLMVTAGNTGGGTYAFNYKNNYRIDGTDYFSNAKFSTSNGKAKGDYHVSLEGGANALLHVYTVGKEDESIEPTFAVGSITHNVSNDEYKDAGKATCFMEQGSDICYVALGANGFVAVDVNENAQVMHSVSNLLVEGNTNAISADDKYIYLANGADGVYFCEKPTISKGMADVEITPSYKWDEAIVGASANFVTVLDNEYIFVAKGSNGGLKLIKRQK